MDMSSMEKYIKKLLSQLPALLLQMVLMISLWMTGSAIAADQSSHIKSVTAITEVFGTGQKLTAAAVEYDRDIAASKLLSSAFTVDGRTITKAYSNTIAGKAAKGSDGRYVILELSPTDAAAAIFSQNGPNSTRVEAKVSVKQTGDIAAVDGGKCEADSRVTVNSKTINMVVDDFKNFEFNDPKTGETIKYNLYIPKNYDKGKSYPMVMFIHDAGIVSNEIDRTLVQGLGAVVWATPGEQIKHPCFVLAPQFSTGGTDSSQRWDTIVDLINSLTGQYSIDKNRLYTTGQSMGCMLSIAIGIKYPDLFAGYLLVAGQWDASVMSVLADKKMWIIVSEGDRQAFPGMNGSLAVMEPSGARISRATWNARAGEAEKAANVKKMAEESTNIKYSVFQKGTTLSEEEKDSGRNEHMQTWWVAYGIEGVRDWLFAQKK
jgi:predicted peptidase